MAALSRVINESTGVKEGSFLKSGGLVMVVDEKSDLAEQGAGLLEGVPMASKTVDFTLEVLAPPDWFLSILPVAGSVVKGSPAIFDVTSRAEGGFVGSLSLSIVGLPSGVVATITPQIIVQNGTSRISIPTDALPITVNPPAGPGPIRLQLKGDTV